MLNLFRKTVPHFAKGAPRAQQVTHLRHALRIGHNSLFTVAILAVAPMRLCHCRFCEFRNEPG